MNPGAEILYNYLRDVIYDPAHAALDFEKLPEDFLELGKGLQFFAECVTETTALAKELSKGDLNDTLPSPENEMAAPLKALHATLKHLTWQTQQVATGDYQQRVDFMGDFSKAFIITEVDENLYASKKAGKNRVTAPGISQTFQS